MLLISPSGRRHRKWIPYLCIPLEGDITSTPLTTTAVRSELSNLRMTVSIAFSILAPRRWASSLLRSMDLPSNYSGEHRTSVCNGWQYYWIMGNVWDIILCGTMYGRIHYIGQCMGECTYKWVHMNYTTAYRSLHIRRYIRTYSM